MESYFTLNENRSERALQAAILVPALQDQNKRFLLLNKIETNRGEQISKKESDEAQVMHFVWVLRDSFYAFREASRRNKNWKQLRSKWCEILSLPEGLLQPEWWQHPDGSFEGDPEFIVHPCNREIGWTDAAIRARIKRYGLKVHANFDVNIMINARKVMNTECDCLIQTSNRLIVIECKDKTEFREEQQSRQQKLFLSLSKLLPRPLPLEYVEIAAIPEKSRERQFWSWESIKSL